MASLAAEDFAQPQAYFYLGKFQPFHNGHLNVLTQMVKQAKKDKARVFLFSTNKHNNVTHPIPPKKKEKMLQQIVNDTFPEIHFKMVNGLYDATKELANENISHATIMAGNDRKEEYIKQGKKGMNNVFFTVLPIDRTKDNISGTLIRNKILRGEPDVYNHVDKVYTPKAFTKLVNTIHMGATTPTPARVSRKKPHSQTPRASKKSSAGKKAKTYRRRRSCRPRRHRRTRRNVST